METDAPALQLTPLEARILGSLIEKAVTTPEYYPLTVNALLAACNQKNNRAPVIALDEATLARGLYSLQGKHLLEFFSGASSRVLKYRELLASRLELAPDERAVICELLLRGPQTAGELRNRAARLHPFASLEEVQATLDRLAARPAGPLIAELPRQPGQKETRVAHLLGDAPPSVEVVQADIPLPAAMTAVVEETARLAALETRIATLEDEVVTLKTLFQTFKSQFE